MKYLSAGLILGVSLLLCQCETTRKQSNVIEVGSSQELLDAIGPDRTLKLASGIYDLTATTADSATHHQTREVFDGLERVIKNVSGLRLIGGAGVKLHIAPRYAYVLNFENCRDITLENIEFTHTPDLGYCTGGVLQFENCSGISIDSCVLDGSGTEGLTLRNVTGLAYRDSTIQNCTYGIMTLKSSSQISFTNGAFTDNIEYDLVNIDGCKDVTFDGCRFTGNRAGLDWDYALFNVTSSSGVALRNSTLKDNMAPYFETRQGSIEVSNTNQTANTFPKGEFRE